MNVELLQLVPSLMTITGLMFSVLGFTRHSAVLLFIGLALDVLDGATAREYHVESKFGGRLDWTVDVVVAACLATEVHPLLVVALALWASVADHNGWRVSGRAALTFAACAWWSVQA